MTHPGSAPVPADPAGQAGHHAHDRTDRGTDCSEVLLRVYEYIDQEMTEADCVRIKAHLEECGDCMGAYERDRLLKALIRRSCAREAAPETLRMSIMTRITMVRGQFDQHVRYEERISYEEG